MLTAPDVNLIKAVRVLPSSLVLRTEGDIVRASTAENLTSFRYGMKCFFEEGRALAKINHPNVVRVLNFFRANETVYMVMRYERGRTLQQQILHQERLEVQQIAQSDAAGIATILESHISSSDPAAPFHRAQLRDVAGRCYPLEAVATGIGRHDDNDVVLDDPKVSRHHATIIDTGASFVINDLRSANGVEVADQRIRGSATLYDGDVISIAGYRFTFEAAPTEAHDHDPT